VRFGKRVFDAEGLQTLVQQRGEAMGQISFADAEYAGKRKKTRREVFLEEMELVVPWKALLKVIEPFYPAAGRARRPYPPESMLECHSYARAFCSALVQRADGVPTSPAAKTSSPVREETMSYLKGPFFAYFRPSSPASGQSCPNTFVNKKMCELSAETNSDFRVTQPLPGGSTL
jgi:hypothetical protein